MLERALPKTKLHANISPSDHLYITTNSGGSELGFRYTIRGRYGQVDLYIDRIRGSAEENAKIFDALHAKREKIEAVFGRKLEWHRTVLHDRITKSTKSADLNDKDKWPDLQDKRIYFHLYRYCRIAKRIEPADLNDKDKWSDLQDKMIDAMIRFHKALNKHIQELNI